MQPSITMRASLDGTVTGNAGPVQFSAKVLSYDSLYGIDMGRVSRLKIEQAGAIALHYDREWIVPVSDEHQQTYKQVMCALQCLPVNQ